jgi:hypothetical protein
MMRNRSLSRRLERLETRTPRTSNPVVIEIRFVSPEMVVTSSTLIEVGPNPAQFKKKHAGDERYQGASRGQERFG